MILVGLFYLLASSIEAGVMRIAGYLIKKYGAVLLLLFTAILSVIRFFIYAFEPDIWWVLSTSIIHGFIIGFFIPAAVFFCW
jgi:PPP family 3-phenylpropionic acid transporter